jgi:protein-tyrosine phosphatase
VDSNKVFVDSAGTAGYHVGNAPDQRSIDVARKHGLDIGFQKCRRFSEMDFTEFDCIYVMDRSNLSNVVSLAKNTEEINKVKLLLDEVNLGIKEVPDPYYGGVGGFEDVYQMIDMACEAIAKKLN